MKSSPLPRSTNQASAGLLQMEVRPVRTEALRATAQGQTPSHTPCPSLHARAGGSRAPSFSLPEEGRPPGRCTVPTVPCGTYLVGLVEEQAEVREHHPQLLPPVAVFEFSQQVPGQLILKDKHARKEHEWGAPLPAARRLVFVVRGTPGRGFPNVTEGELFSLRVDSRSLI